MDGAGQPQGQDTIESDLLKAFLTLREPGSPTVSAQDAKPIWAWSHNKLLS